MAVLLRADPATYGPGRLSLATAYVALALLAATLAIGALNVLGGRHNPLSIDLRRDIGIWCGVISLAHVAIGLQVHAGNMLKYFFWNVGGSSPLAPRLDLFGLANYIGLIATVLALLLLALSNDASLRALGAARWKFWQRWNYGFALLLLPHSIAYQYMEKRALPYLLLFGLIAGAIVVVQLMGMRRRRRAEQP